MNITPTWHLHGLMGIRTMAPTLAHKHLSGGAIFPVHVWDLSTLYKMKSPVCVRGEVYGTACWCWLFKPTGMDLVKESLPTLATADPFGSRILGHPRGGTTQSWVNRLLLARVISNPKWCFLLFHWLPCHWITVGLHKVHTSLPKASTQHGSCWKLSFSSADRCPPHTCRVNVVTARKAYQWELWRLLNKAVPLQPTWKGAADGQACDDLIWRGIAELPSCKHFVWKQEETSRGRTYFPQALGAVDAF